MTKQQMELSFNNATAFRPSIRRHRKSRRSHWWFQQMREIVDRAFDHRPAPLPRPEQIYLTLPGRAAACRSKVEIKSNGELRGETGINQPVKNSQSGSLAA